jgi:hypothetical protein
MHEPKGRTLPLSGPRRFINDLVHHAGRIPSVPVSRMMDLGPLVGLRRSHAHRPSWSVLFMKAYAIVAAANPPLRRALMTFPNIRLYEHPGSICALAIERVLDGEEGIFVGLFRTPECQSLVELDAALTWYKTAPIDEIGLFRQTLRVSAAPRPIRRLLWWSTLAVSGLKRAKRFGTFGLSTYGSLGAEQMHPISPLTTTLTFGPIDQSGRVCVKIIYDHRVLDGAYVARRLGEIEATLQGAISEELSREVMTGPRLAGPEAA